VDAKGNVAYGLGFAVYGLGQAVNRKP